MPASHAPTMRDYQWVDCELEESVSSIDWSAADQSLQDESLPSLLGRLPSEEKGAGVSRGSSRRESSAQASSSSLSRWDSGSKKNPESLLTAMSNCCTLHDSRRSSTSESTVKSGNSRVSRSSRIAKQRLSSCGKREDQSPCLIRRQATITSPQEEGKKKIEKLTASTKKDRMPSLVRRQMTKAPHAA